jgi:hypothetical protein
MAPGRMAPDVRLVALARGRSPRLGLKGAERRGPGRPGTVSACPRPRLSKMEAERAFARAARGRRLASVICRLRRGDVRCGRLAVHDRGMPRRPGVYAGRRVREIRLDAIAATVDPNRAEQFDRGFRPAAPTRSRWERVWLAEHHGTVLPPMSGGPGRHHVRDPRRSSPRLGGEGARCADHRRGRRRLGGPRARRLYRWATGGTGTGGRTGAW